MMWTRGPDVGPIHNRSAMACTAAGDSYVAWGGRNSTDTLSSTVIFDINNKAWTDTFMLTVLTEQASKSNGVIIGGSVAAVVIILITGILIYRRTTKKKQDDKSSASDKRSIADSEHLLVSDDNDRNPQAITLKAPRYAEGPRPPEYVAPQPGKDQFYRQHNPALENNPQFMPRLQYQDLPTSDPQLIIPRDPQFRFGEPQVDLNALLR
ncbi:MAG: hypothetical protein J3R72DRAFT_212328 [Linnemannia gamsii]|nr:MAG: hypothetical protein J3R72DRAFT_212328 [Linnemannia gamsii]